MAVHTVTQAPTFYEPGLKDYLTTLRRRAWPAAIAFVAVFAVSGVVALMLPPTYRATGTILVESQQIPDDLIRSTVTSFADERILVIKQRVMTQSNLRNIIDKYNLFEKQRESAPASEIMDMMRARIGVELISADVVGNRKTTIAFKVSYDDAQADVAYKVANELLTLFLDENVRTRTARATETTEFLTQESDKLRKNLDSVEEQIALYKQKHGDALPEHLELHMGMLTRLESETKEIERAYKDAQAEARMLEIELNAAMAGRGSPGSLTNPAAATPAQQLAAYRTEFTKLSTTYSPNHPSLRALQRKIEALEKSVGDPASAKTSIAPNPDDTELAVARTQARIDAAEARMASLAQQIKTLRSQRAQYEGKILQTPQVERGMTSLLRDYENAKTKFEEVRSKQMSAQISESLEEGKKAERFALLEPPVMPDVPIEPNRKKIAAMGFFLALVSSGGVVMALETVQQRVHGVNALAALLKLQPLVAIPYIHTQAELTRRKPPRRLWLIVSAALLLLLVAAGIATHFLYQPLDMVWIKFLAGFE
jgi:polysaccharide chain length determinant protein (PEP-CTERM system associated)